jgi:hypothetical protein
MTAMYKFEFIEGSLDQNSRLAQTARRLVEKFNQRKKLTKFKRRRLTAPELHHLREVTIRETPPEMVEKRMEKIRREVGEF